MLKVFRDNLKNLAWILWVIIAIFVLAIAADFGASVRQRGSADTVPEWGSETVSQAEVKRAHQPVMEMYRQVYGGQLPRGMEKQLYQQTLAISLVQEYVHL